MPEDFTKYLLFKIIFASIFIALCFGIRLVKNFIYVGFKEKLIRKRVFEAMVVIIPACFSIFSSYWMRDLKDNIYSFTLFIGLPYFSFFFAYLLVINWAKEKVQMDSQNELNKIVVEREVFNAQINSLSQIVALEEYVRKLIKVKASRFLDFYNNLCKNDALLKQIKANKDSIFNTITQPDQQRFRLLRLAHEYFEKYIIAKDHKCNITLMRPMPDDKLEFIDHIEPPMSKGKDIFAYGRSAAGKAWLKGDMIIIPDKQLELSSESGHRTYEQGERDAKDDIGSLICYPVFDFDLIPDRKRALIYVVNVTSSMSNNFLIEDKPQYEKILKSFGERLILEYRLAIIKDLVDKA